MQPFQDNAQQTSWHEKCVCVCVCVCVWQRSGTVTPSIFSTTSAKPTLFSIGEMCVCVCVCVPGSQHGVRVVFACLKRRKELDKSCEDVSDTHLAGPIEPEELGLVTDVLQV
jgi:hypothetical protein